MRVPAVGRDAVVIGAGHNGLVAANLLADAGWDVLVLEAQPEPGGAVRSGRGLHPDFVTDLFSAFYPLGAASPVLRELDLHRHGLEWVHSPLPLAHVLPDGRSVVLSRDPARTAESVSRFATADGEHWLGLYAHWQRMSAPFVEVITRPFPPVRAAARMVSALGAGDTLRFARTALSGVRRFTDETFDGEGARLLVAGNAMHTDLTLESAGGAVFGLLLAMLGQQVGFPVPRGGAGRLIGALVDRLRSRGGEVVCDAPVTEVVVREGVALGVRTADGTAVRARRGVLADVVAPALFLDLVGQQHLPSGMVRDLQHFEWDHPTVKVNWALGGPIPWQSAEVGQAGTVHLDLDMRGLSDYAHALSVGRRPERPFILLGQMTTSDPSRSPAGTESVWAYTHLPRAQAGPDAVKATVAAIEDAVERHAPGFRSRIIAQEVQGPADLSAADANLVSGAVNGGTANLSQQLVFRPVPGLSRAETPVQRLYLAGSSAHPGGGVHGACGANAARAALAMEGGTGLVRRALTRGAWRAVAGS